MKHTIQNVVVTASAGCTLDLPYLAKELEEAQYTPAFPGMVIRTDNPKAAVLLFASGKMVCAGAKSAGLAGQAIGAILRLLYAHGVEADGQPAVTIQNMVATAELGCPLLLDRAVSLLPRAMYEPEMFPGIVCRMVDPKVTVILFASGKMTLTGAKSYDDVLRAFASVRLLLEAGGVAGPAADTPVPLDAV